MKSKRAKNCRNLNSSEAVGTSSDIFGNVRKSSQIVGNLRKSLGRFQKSRSRQSKNLTHLTQKKLAGIKSTAHFLNNSFLFKAIILTSSETQGQSVGSWGATKVSFQFKAIPPVLENFRRPFSPDPTDCSWVSEDVILICARRIFNAALLNVSSDEETGGGWVAWMKHCFSWLNRPDVICIGDINCDLLHPVYNGKQGRELLDICDVYDLHNLINEPTRVFSTKESCLDVLYYRRMYLHLLLSLERLTLAWAIIC